ncbi:MAG: TIGR03862 family flavoprotein [Parvibaculum sp.]|nr:TIGR03862 family flavoprotein [Parvibaculum sp.]
MNIDVAIIGGGPAGLMAAEALMARGHRPHLFDAMPSLGRKFLMAGKSGLNLTHSEEYTTFVTRFGESGSHLRAALDAMPPEAIAQWADGLGVKTFTGTSGRIFPTDFKAAPLLRAWIKHLRDNGLTIHVRHRWTGWDADGALTFETREGAATVMARSTVLALGGASWPQLGSDASWVAPLEARGAAVTPLAASNCGFDVNWTPFVSERFAGAPVKPVVLSFDGESHRGEFVVTAKGVEGSGVYALASRLRETIERDGQATLMLDLAPDRSAERLQGNLSRPRDKASFANFLRKVTGIDGVKAALLRECLPKETFDDMAALAAGIKAVPQVLRRARPIEEAISSAGGVAFTGLDEHYMLRNMAGIFCAGEMLDWDAPTGGYLLSACFATGRAAGIGAATWLEGQP